MQQNNELKDGLQCEAHVASQFSTMDCYTIVQTLCCSGWHLLSFRLQTHSMQPLHPHTAREPALQSLQRELGVRVQRKARFVSCTL